MFSVTSYTDVSQSWTSRAAAYQALGVGRRCKGHCARVAKTRDCCTFLICRLKGSTPGCSWAACLVEVSRDYFELRLQEESFASRAHNNDSQLLGIRGPANLQVIDRIDELFQ